MSKLSPEAIDKARAHGRDCGKSNFVAGQGWHPESSAYRRQPLRLAFYEGYQEAWRAAQARHVAAETPQEG